jgi:alcohol dehydrogenase
VLSTSFEFVCNVRLASGIGRRHAVGGDLAGLGVNRTLIVASERFCGTAHFEDIITGLKDHSAVVGVWSDVKPQSSLDAVEGLAAQLQDTNAEGVIVVGGGSAICLTKFAVAVACENKPPRSLVWGYNGATRELTLPKLAAPKLPIIAMPTTSGSAAETNKYGAVRDHVTGRRIGVRDAKLVPKVAILDPELTESMDEELTAGSGANALAHCIETLYSVDANPAASAVALDAARLIIAHLPRCVADPGNLEARSMMQLATALSGIALDNAMIGVHHAFCHALACGRGMPHGTANYIMLPHALRYNAEGSDKARAALIEFGLATDLLSAEEHRSLPSVEASGMVIDRLELWLKALGAPSRIRDTGYIRHDELTTLAEDVFTDQCIPYNPRRVEDSRELTKVLEAAW